MYLTFVAFSGLLALTGSVAALVYPPPGPPNPPLRPVIPKPVIEVRKPCPSVWYQVKAELNTTFTAGSGTQCNDLARAAIRAVFHDCGTWDLKQGNYGGCDGSLFVGVNPDIELDRIENKGLQKIAVVIKGLAQKYNTSVADMTVFAGNAATSICPQGPLIRTFIGRKDNTTSAPVGKLPDVHDSAANISALFRSKGFTALDLAALLGAHSTATQLFVDPSQANKSQDSSPGVWDVRYYKETLNFAQTGRAPSGVFVFPSDSKLAIDPTVGPSFQSFINRQGDWHMSYRAAAGNMSLFGNDATKLIDCTVAVQS